MLAEVVPAPVERQPAVEIDLTPPPPEVLSLANISGRWCADQLELDFSADTMAFTVNKRRLDYTVSSYEYEQDLVRVSWRDRRVGMIFEFGRFSEDGGRMTQLRGRRADGGNWQTYNRPLQRCP